MDNNDYKTILMAITEVKTEVKNLEKVVDSLNETVINNRDSLVTKVAILEAEVEELKQDDKTQKIQENYDKSLKKDFLSKVIVAVISGLFGVIISILGWYLSKGF